MRRTAGRPSCGDRNTYKQQKGSTTRIRRQSCSFPRYRDSALRFPHLLRLSILLACRRPSAIRPFPAQPRGVVIPPPSDAVGRGAAAGWLVVLALCFAGQRPVVRTSKTPCRFLVTQVALIRRDLWKKDCSKPTIYQLDQQDVRQVYVLKDFGEMRWKGRIVEVVWIRGWSLVWFDLVWSGLFGEEECRIVEDWTTSDYTLCD